MFRINVHAPFHAAVEAARQMPDGGRIIVIGSANGDRMPIAGMAAYALSKSAMRCTRSTVRSSREFDADRNVDQVGDAGIGMVEPILANTCP